MYDLRRRVDEVLEGREEREEALRYVLEVAVSHVVHEVDVGYVARKRDHGSRLRPQGREQRYGEEGEVGYVLPERMDHRCHIRIKSNQIEPH